MTWISRSGSIDGLDELQELLMAVPGHAFMDDMACGDVEGCEEGGGAVPLVVVRHGAGSALLEWEAGLGAVQSLDRLFSSKEKTTALSGGFM